MATRIPASQRTREGLTALIEGRLSTASAKDELVKLATRLVVEEALDGEAGDAVGAHPDPASERSDFGKSYGDRSSPADRAKAHLSARPKICD